MVKEIHYLDAIREEPDEDSYRLAYADWLEEHKKLYFPRLS